MSINSVVSSSRMTIIESNRATVRTEIIIQITSRVANWSLLATQMAEARVRQNQQRDEWWWDNEGNSTITHCSSCCSCCSSYSSSTVTPTDSDSEEDTREKILTAAQTAFCVAKETRL